MPGMVTTHDLTQFSADQLCQLATTLRAWVEQQDQVIQRSELRNQQLSQEQVLLKVH